MELFVVNRYEGEEEKKLDNTNNHLAELLKRIEERKKERAQVGNDEENVDDNKIVDDKNVESKSTRRGKKRKKLLKTEDDSEKITNETLNEEPNEQLELKSNENVTKDSKKTTEIKQQQDFMILGATTKKRKAKVQRVLPKWLANPEVISADLNTGPKLDEFVDKLDPQLIETLRKNGIEKLFPAQASLIDWMIKCNDERKLGRWPRDTCVSAPTGSGKTLAYVLPIIQHLKDRFIRVVRCLIVLPVQELANQVYNVVVNYSANTNLRVGLITGATSLETEQTKLVRKTQRGKFISRVDIVVATPGRLIDHIEKSEGFSLENLEFLIIDEADRAAEWLQYLPEPHCYPRRIAIDNSSIHRLIPPAQKLLFSATLSQDPEKISRLGLFQPILFTSVLVTGRDDDVDLDKEVGKFIGRYTSPNELTERAVECTPEYKPVCLVKLLTADNTKGNKSLVFTNSGEAAHRLAILLRSILSEYNIVVNELSALMMPTQRAEVLKKFTTGEIQVLVSSDALARGLDIPGVKLVVSYDLPKYIKGYIHRSGRTGRAGLEGTAISILTSKQVGAFNRMLSSAHKRVPTIERIESIEEFADNINYESHLVKLKEALDNQQTKEVERFKAAKRRRSNVNKNKKE